MFFEDFFVGQEFLIPPVSVTKEQILSFADQYDPLPLHLDEEYARGTSFNGLIAPGVMSFMVVWSEFVRMSAWKENLLAGKSTKIEWFAPVYPGNVLTGVARVLSCENRKKDNGLILLCIDVANERASLVLRDVTELIVRKKGR